MIVAYMCYTMKATDWRIAIRRTMNESDTDANTKAVDSLLNYETVKYFGAEEREARALRPLHGALRARQREGLCLARHAQRRPGGRSSPSGLTICMAMVVFGIRAGTQHGRRSRDDQRDADPALPAAELHGHGLSRDQAGPSPTSSRCSTILARKPEIEDKPSAPAAARRRRRRSRFEDVHFAYVPERAILRGISFEVPAGKTVAIVGPVGRRQVDHLAAAVPLLRAAVAAASSIDGQDIRDVTQASLRAAIGMVPQDTVLFNDTIGYNIRYGRWEASEEEVREAAAPGPDRPLHRRPAGGLRHAGRRARAEALGRREAARRHRAHHPEGPADPGARRGDLGARQLHREGHPGRARAHLARAAPRSSSPTGCRP